MPVYVFGSNIMGQCGLPDEYCNGSDPTKLPLEGEKVECGYMHTLLLHNRTIISWGVNDDGALGREGDEMPSKINLDEEIIDISAGGSVSAAVSAQGNLYAWGTFRDMHGVFGLTPDCLIGERPVKICKDIVKVACGRNFISALNKKSELITFGIGERNELGYKSSKRHKRCLVPRQISNRYKKDEKFCSVYAGPNYGMAINKDKKLYSWESGRLRLVCDYSVSSLSMGTDHVHIITEDGSIYSRGKNLDGQLGLGYKDNILDKKPNNDYLIWKKLNLENVDKVCTKMDFSIAKIGDTLYSWGPSTFGETGFKDSSSLEPRKIPFDFGEIVDFSVGSDFSVVIGK